jgi:hypothetical protein
MFFQTGLGMGTHLGCHSFVLVAANAPGRARTRFGRNAAGCLAPAKQALDAFTGNTKATRRLALGQTLINRLHNPLAKIKR